MRGSIEVHRYLTERGIPHEFYRLDRPLRRLEGAAALLGLKPERVVAAALFEARRSPVLALFPAGMRVRARVVAKASGDDRVRPAKAARVAASTGFLPGWLPPVGHQNAPRVVLDANVAREEVLYAPGGDPGVMLVIRASDLVRATAATITDLVPEAAETSRDPVASPGSNLLAG